jgi:helicase
MVGRAGRPSYDPVGDAYILLPEQTYDMHKDRIKSPQMILSQMLDEEGGHYKVLAFHLVSEIHQETIKTREDVHYWYKRSLGHFQANELDETTADGVIDSLKKCGAVWEENGLLTATSIGKIASLFYYSPFDVSDLKRNFTQLFDDRKENDDLFTAIALANLDTHRFGIVSKAEREDMNMFVNTVGLKFGRNVLKEPVIKTAYVYHQLLNGLPNPVFASMSRTLQFDFPRLNQVLQAIDGFTGKWNKTKWFRELQLRVNYGVKGDLVHLVQLPGIGQVRANKLYKAGIKTINDVVNNPAAVRKITGLKKDKVDEIMTEAKRLL